MNEHFDPLEAELAALRPREPSPDLKSRIAERLAADGLANPPTTGKPIARWLAIQAINAAALAASLVMAALLWRGQRPTIVERPDDKAVQPIAPIAIALDRSLPSVWTYERALARSAGDLDAALDKHASAGRRQSRPASQFLIRSQTGTLIEGEL
jgi:hypothetical protein